jgi:exo-beta-1,3-glucanase (GH17 family)
MSGLLIVAGLLAHGGHLGLRESPDRGTRLASRIQGFAFQPVQKDQDAIAREEPTIEQIDSDLALLEGKTNAVRTYSTLGTVGQVPAREARHPRYARRVARHRSRA